MKKLLYAFLIAAVAAVHSGCKDDEETFVHVEKVSIDVRELHLNPGKTYQLSVTIERRKRHQPENRLVQLQYQRGHRRQERSGHGAGFRRGDAHSRSQRHARQRRDPSHDRRRGQQHSHRKPDARRHVQDIRLRADPGVGAFRFAPAILPENATNKKLKWTSDDPLVAGIDDDGVLVPVSHGKTTIRVSTTDGGNKTARAK